jgi:hypothetical protein
LEAREIFETLEALEILEKLKTLEALEMPDLRRNNNTYFIN